MADGQKTEGERQAKNIMDELEHRTVARVWYLAGAVDVLRREGYYLVREQSSAYPDGAFGDRSDYKVDTEWFLVFKKPGDYFESDYFKKR